MKKTRRDEKKPNFIYKFDNKKYSKEEQSLLISQFIQTLSRLESNNKGECHV